MTMNFNFKIEIKFPSLRQFKDVILKHYMLNGKDVRFKKNDANMFRVVCKHRKKYDYTMLCSKIVKTKTFRVNTLFSKHKCGRKII